MFGPYLSIGTTLHRCGHHMLGEELEAWWRRDLHDFSTFPPLGSQAVAPHRLDCRGMGTLVDSRPLVLALRDTASVALGLGAFGVTLV
jgi:hypothetical protein